MQSDFNIGIIGYGFLGNSLHRNLLGSRINVSKIYNRSSERLAELPTETATTDMQVFLDALDSLDLVVELAHADLSAQFGQQILQHSHYMPCSVSALANDDLRNRLIKTAREAGTRIFIPHGAAVGMDNLAEAKEKWQQVNITFRKPAASIDGADEVREEESILFDGSIREIAQKFPRSVNSMVACALATDCLDQSRARMIADNRLENVLSGEFEFLGDDGSKLTITKEEPAVGISSTGMINSLTGSVKRALALSPDTLSFV
jgi:aspartate dehydrogenase